MQRFLLLILCVFPINLTFCQTFIEPNDSLNKTKDSLQFKPLKYKETDLKSEVVFNAKDSIIYDAESKFLILYTGGKIKYDDIELQSDFINYNTDSSVLSAEKVETIASDSVSHEIFTQGEQTFTFHKLQYNFKSQRALVETAFTNYNEGFIHSEQIKRNADESIFGINNVYSTCNLEHPHFGIKAKKIKIIPNVVAISGPANIEIEGIPTPLVLPFGIYPMQKGQHAGFILPKQRFETNRGFGLTGAGYYFPISDYMDLTAFADLYTYGSWTTTLSTNYLRRYRYGGSLRLSYSSVRFIAGENFNPNIEQTFNVNWNHNVNAKALNGASFSAQVNFGTRNNNKFNFNNDINNYLNNDISSSVIYNKSWVGKPYNLAVSLRHNQNNNTGLYTFRLPEINFNVNSIQPFKINNRIGKEKWFEKFRFTYNAAGINEVSFYDSLLQRNGIRNENLNNGISQRASLAANYKVFKYFNFSIGANYNEYWYTRKRFRFYNIDDARLDTVTNYGFFTARNWNTNASLNTTVYGMKHFKKGFIRGLRQTITPSLNFNYNPDFGSGIYNYFYSTFLDANLNSRRISYFEGSIIGNPQDGKNGSIGFSISTILQAKIANKKDSITGVKKLNLLDNLSTGINYNLAADSFKWSDVNIAYSTLLFNKFNISGGTLFSPYAWDTSRNTRSSTLLINSAEKKLLRFVSAGINMSTSFKSLAKDAKSKATEEQSNAIYNNFSAYYDFNIPWDVGINTRFDVRKLYNRATQKDSLDYGATLTLNGNINLTPNWKIAVSGVGVNIITQKINSMQLGLVRDLHCWQMNVSVIPFGFTRSYNFTLGVKSSVLQDLKLAKNKQFTDNF